MTEENNGDRKILTGTYFQSGNWAAAEGAITAGVTTFFGYPITPSTEIAERMALRLPEVGGIYRQFEDEIASIIACIGSSWAGAKTLTATSGPGFSLMQEGIGLAAMTETPLVLVNSQRAGPSTGMPTMAGQGDFLQTQFGSHGDYPIVSLAPNGVQESFDLMQDAYRISETLRVIVVFLMDQVVSSIEEKVQIPSSENIPQITRPLKGVSSSPLGDELVPPMKVFGEGHSSFGTGLTYSTETGYPMMDPEVHESLVMRLRKKIDRGQEEGMFPRPETIELEDAKIVVVSFGSVSRSSEAVVRQARKKGIKVGSFRLKTVWPFPSEEIEKLSESIEKFIVPEMSLGQLIWAVERFGGRKKCVHLPFVRGRPHPPSQILDAIRRYS